MEFTMFKRIGYFLITNLLIVITISFLLSILGVRPYLNAAGLDYGSLAIFCLVWGMAGAFISLALSRISAKWMLGVKVIDPNRGGELQWLVAKVHDLARKAGLSTMPEVGVYESPEVNAFATGPTKNRSLVAVSTGLLRAMNTNELDGVLGHEITHIQNGDMVTMTLVQGVVNAFVMFIARVVAYFISQTARDDSDRVWIRYLVTMFAELVFGFLGMTVVAGFSRAREFKADAGSAKLSGQNNMIAALQALGRIHGMPTPSNASLAPFKIAGKQGGGLRGLFSLATHPPLEERIAALQKLSHY